MSENTLSAANLDFNLRVFKRVAEIMPKKVPELIATFAEDGDLDLLEAILKSRIAEPKSKDIRPALLAAIFPVRRTAADKERAGQMVRDWLGWLGVQSDTPSLSTYLASVSWSTTAQELIAIGADPNYGIGHANERRTPVGELLEKGYQTALISVLDHLKKTDVIPLYSTVDAAKPGDACEQISLFSVLIEDLRKYVVDYLFDRELPLSWRVAVGEALSQRSGGFAIGYMEDSFDELVKLISVAKFSDPSQWQIALSNDSYMGELAGNGSRAPVLSRIVHAAAEDGVDINTWRAPLRLKGIEYPVPLLAAAVHLGQEDLVQQYLQLGAETNIRMPAPSDAPGEPYTGMTLLEYAQQEAAAGGTHQMLAAWRAQEVVRDVVGKLKPSCAKGAL